MFKPLAPTTNSEVKTLHKLSKNGLSQDPFEVVRFNDEPKIPTYICQPNKQAINRYFCNEAYGQGSALNATVAKLKSIAEFLERLAINNPRKADLIKQEYIEGPCADPNLFVHYSDVQIKLHNELQKGLKGNTYLWSSAFDYLNKKKILVPSQLIYISDLFRNETLIASEQITTGAALGDRPKSVFESGFLEVVERDAFMISYLTKRKLARITLFPESINELISYLKRYYIDILVFDITTDLCIPAFMAIAVDRRGFGPGISVGLKAGFDAESVIFGSILEAVQPRRQSRYSKELDGAKFKFPTEHEIDSMPKRYYYWYPTKMIKHLDFWLKSNKTVRFARMPEYATALKEGIGQLKDRDYHIYYADITLKEINKIGFIAAKVLIPELHPLYLSENSKFLYSAHGGNIKPAKGLKPHPFA